MEIKISTQLKLKIMYFLTGIIFIGLCIEAGGFIFNTLFTLFFNPIGANYFWKEIDLSDLYKFDSGYFFCNSIVNEYCNTNERYTVLFDSKNST